MPSAASAASSSLWSTTSIPCGTTSAPGITDANDGSCTTTVSASARIVRCTVATPGARQRRGRAHAMGRGELGVDGAGVDDVVHRHHGAAAAQRGERRDDAGHRGRAAVEEQLVLEVDGRRAGGARRGGRRRQRAGAAPPDAAHLERAVAGDVRQAGLLGGEHGDLRALAGERVGEVGAVGGHAGPAAVALAEVGERADQGDVRR